MKLPSPQQFLEKLNADPAAAAAFDLATQRERPGKSRREAVADCHRLATATLAEIELNKRKLVIARAKIAALEAARKSAPVATRPAARPATLTIRDQYNALATPEAREKFRAANWSALLSSPK